MVIHLLAPSRYGQRTVVKLRHRHSDLKLVLVRIITTNFRAVNQGFLYTLMQFPCHLFHVTIHCLVEFFLCSRGCNCSEAAGQAMVGEGVVRQLLGYDGLRLVLLG